MYELATLILNAIYVVATLAIVGITIWQIKKSAKQAQDALAASEKQVRDTLAASAKQAQDALAASEKQSQAAINVVREQMEESKRQAQEALHNQFKPVVVPISQTVPLYDEGNPLRIKMTNKGAGVALNMFGIFFTNGSRSNEVYHFVKNYFLVPDGKEEIHFNRDGDGIKIRPLNDFYGYPTYPGDMPRENDKGISDVSRLMITYEDIFGNKYFIVFRYCDVPKEEYVLMNENMKYYGMVDEPGWEKTDLKRVERRLDELIIQS